jgi:threonine aldolase
MMGHLGHTFLFEGGGVAALGGVNPRTLLNQPDGTLRLDEISAGIRSDDPHYPVSRLVILENTHNRCGGTPLTVAYTRQVGELVHANHMQLHLDGARIFNAAVALGVPASELAKPADSVTFCLSKALCAPVGSVLCGSGDFIYRARRIRKQLGGGMRQAGILAAAGIIALENMVDRLAEDHQRARRLAVALVKIDGLKVDTTQPSTNMVYTNLSDDVQMSAFQVAAKMKEFNVRVGIVNPRRFRMVLHYYIDDEGVERTIKAFQHVF